MCNHSDAEGSTLRQRGKRSDGSCYQLNDGTWRVAVPFGKGRMRTARAHSAAEAEEHRRALLRQREADIVAKLPASGGRQTMRQWLERLLHEKEARVKPTTLRFYRQVSNSYILPIIGSDRIEAITPDDIIDLLDEYLDHGTLATSTIHHIWQVTNMALELALRRRYIAYNPARAVDPPRVILVPQYALQTSEISQLLHAVAGHRLAPLYQLILTLGLRRGESLGLRWQDFDEAQAELRITQQIVEVDGRIIVQSPKTRSSSRMLPIPPRLLVVLQAHRMRQECERTKYGLSWQEHGLIFAS